MEHPTSTLLSLQKAAALDIIRAQLRPDLYVGLSKIQRSDTIEVRRSRSPAVKASEHLGMFMEFVDAVNEANSAFGLRCATIVYSKLGANASRLNLRSPPPASSSLFKKALTPNRNALSVNTSSSASSVPRFKGPLRRPSSSHRLFWADLMKATKCRSTEAVADNAAVSPCAAADS